MNTKAAKLWNDRSPGIRFSAFDRTVATSTTTAAFRRKASHMRVAVITHHIPRSAAIITGTVVALLPGAVMPVIGHLRVAGLAEAPGCIHIAAFNGLVSFRVKYGLAGGGCGYVLLDVGANELLIVVRRRRHRVRALGCI